MRVAIYLLQGFALAFVIPVLSASIYYLGYWAKITEFIWSRYSKPVADFMHCPACQGTWTTGILATACWYVGMPFLIFPAYTGTPAELAIPGLRWCTPFVAALWGMYWVPRLANKHLEAMSSIPVVEANDPPTTDQ